jgi:outer membrane biosynthesis protein TonB
VLDEAALRTIRALSSLPAATPQDVVLPVRFRLR